MKGKIYDILGEITDIEAEITSMIHILDMLEQAYDWDEQKEVVSCVMVFRGWVKNLEKDMSEIRSQLDDYSIKFDL